MQARGRTHQAQRCRGSSDGGSSVRWLMQRAELLRLCPRHKPLMHGWALGASALPSHTTDSHRGQMWATGERSSIDVAVQVSKEGTQD